MKKLSLLNRISIVIVIIIIILFYILSKINKIASPILLAQAKESSYNIITKIINTSVNTITTNNLKTNDLFIITYDNSGDIIRIDFDSLIINKVLTEISLDIERNINKINNEIYKIPFGIVFKNSFLNNLGPQIPIKIKLVGSIVNNIETEITNYGINNALIEVYVSIDVNVQVVLPFISDKIKVSTLIPLAIKLIRGNVPEYYAGNNTSNPLVTIPIE